MQRQINVVSRYPKIAHLHRFAVTHCQLLGAEKLDRLPWHSKLAPNVCRPFTSAGRAAMGIART